VGSGHLVDLCGGRVWLFPGSVGFLVERLQGHLRAAGMNCPVDGIYGEKTDEVVRFYQSRSGLTVTGHLNEETWCRLSDDGAPLLEVRCASVVAYQNGLGRNRIQIDREAREIRCGFWGLSSRGGMLFDLLSSMPVGLREQALEEGRSKLLDRVIAWDPDRQEVWTREFWLGTDSVSLGWQGALTTMFSHPTSSRHQVDIFHEKIWPRALSIHRSLGLLSEAELALVCWVMGQAGQRARGFQGVTGMAWLREWAGQVGADLRQFDSIAAGKVGRPRSWTQLFSFGIDDAEHIDHAELVKLAKRPAPYSWFGIDLSHGDVDPDDSSVVVRQP